MKARYIIVLSLVIGFSFSSSAQLNRLFISIEEQCWENEKQVIKALINQEFQKAKTDSLLKVWDDLCGSTEASIRTRILYDLRFNGKLEDPIPMDYWKLYFRLFPTYTYVSSPEQLKFLEWTQARADQFSKSGFLSDRDKIVLQLLAAQSNNGAYEILRNKDNYRRPEFDSLRDYLRNEKLHRAGALGFGYSYYFLSGDLAENLGAMHGFTLNVQLPLLSENHRYSLGMDFGLAWSEEKAYLRFDNQGEITTTDLETFLNFDLFLQYRFIDARRSKFSIFGGLGVAQFFTDLSYLNAEDVEVSIHLPEVQPMFGLDYRYEVYGKQSIGLKSVFSPLDFSWNDELRSPLAGIMIRNSIYYQF